jgi:hypothetical protein
MTYAYRQPPIDLFGEVVITHDDLEAWVAAVSPLHLTDRMFDNYVRSYDVAGKVRWSKLRGDFEARTAVRRPIWNARLALGQIL